MAAVVTVLQEMKMATEVTYGFEKIRTIVSYPDDTDDENETLILNTCIND